MKAIVFTHLDELIHTSQAPDTSLPPAPPLTMTRNFVWVVAACGILLSSVPLIAGLVAGAVLR